MINADMRLYDYYIYTDIDDYGAPTLSTETQGQIKMSINTTSQAIQDNVNYSNAQYIGLTKDPNISDKYVIQYEDTQLKVLYINKKGRFKQVFLGAM